MKIKKMIGLTAATLLAALGLGLSTQANAATSKSFYATTTRQVKSGKVTLPANTRVSIWYTATKNHKQYDSIDLTQMSYGIRHTTKATSITIPDSHNLKKLKDNDPSPLSLGKGFKYASNTWAKTPKLNFTTDNYVEYFANGNLNQKPTSSTKITKVSQKDNVTYYYAKKNMLKLPDKRISKKGNHRYRLTVRKNKAVSGDLSISYSVGSSKNYFYTPTLKA